jgi:hypothetical protein
MNIQAHYGQKPFMLCIPVRLSSLDVPTSKHNHLHNLVLCGALVRAHGLGVNVERDLAVLACRKSP